MAIRFQPAKFPRGEAPDVQEITPGSTATFLRGAPVALSSGELIEHAGATTVTGIVGVALHGCDTGVSDSPSGQVAVAKAAHGQVYIGQCISSSAVVTDLAGASVAIGDQYGMLKHTTDEWFVDLDDTTNVVLEISRFDDNLDIVWFKFLDSAIETL